MSTMSANESNKGDRTCLFCGKPVPEGSLLPLCQQHGGTSVEAQRPEGLPKPTCRICGQELPDDAEKPFCGVHLAQYLSRQSEGITTEQLDPSWGDHLGNWRERPDILAAEPYADRLRFRREWGDWLFFWMGYSSRLPDWLLVNPDTGEVRRFVEISENDVRTAIKGMPAANQQDLANRWGESQSARPAPFAEFEEVLANAAAGKAPQLTNYIPDSVPVYVPANSAELMIASLTFGSLQSVSLTFADRPGDYPKSGRTEERLIEVREQIMRQQYELYKERKAEGVTSEQWNWVSFLPDTNADPDQAGTTPSYPPLPTRALELAYSYELTPEPDSQPDVLVDFSSASPLNYFAHTLFSGLSEEVRKQVPEWECQTLCMQVHSVLWSFAPDLVEELAASPTQAIQRNILIATRQFRGVLLCWAHEQPLCAFRLEHLESENVTYRIDGSAFGITLTELQDHLQGLVLLNHNDDLLARYQAQLDAEYERLRSFYGQ